MAVTGFWPVFKNLKATLDYADNPDKTTAPEYLDEDLYAALRYAENDDKTDRKMFVGGINCSAQNAYAEMIAVQRRFGLRGKVVGYHGIQSFREGEVTPEQAFAIGKETARRMWGDRYQVLVTVHLNTDNVHCHFVVNPVSFKDGAKFKNKIGDHKELRKISDEICREHGLSVLENSDFYSKSKKKEYWVRKAGKKTHRDYLREDVEYCLSFATSPREFENQLYALGYTLDPVRFSVKAKHWERAVRLSVIGFTKDRVNAQLRQNAENRYRLFTLEYRPPYKPKKFPLEGELRKLDFSIEHSYDTAAVLVDTLFYLIITVIQIVAEFADVMLLSPDLRAAEKDLKELTGDYHFLQEHDIHNYCFACGAHGDVIDFVGKLFQLSPYDAARKLMADFHLSPDKPPSAAALHAKRIRTEAQQLMENERLCFYVLSDYARVLRNWKVRYAPQSPDKPVHARFVEACHELDEAEYYLDILTSGDSHERAEVIQQQVADGKLDRLRQRLEKTHKEEIEDGYDTAGVA